MKSITIAGIVLIVLGIAALAYQGISYTTTETVIDASASSRPQFPHTR